MDKKEVNKIPGRKGTVYYAFKKDYRDFIYKKTGLTKTELCLILFNDNEHMTRVKLNWILSGKKQMNFITAVELMNLCGYKGDEIDKRLEKMCHKSKAISIVRNEPGEKAYTPTIFTYDQALKRKEQQDARRNERNK